MSTEETIKNVCDQLNDKVCHARKLSKKAEQQSAYSDELIGLRDSLRNLETREIPDDYRCRLGLHILDGNNSTEYDKAIYMDRDTFIRAIIPALQFVLLCKTIKAMELLRSEDRNGNN